MSRFVSNKYLRMSNAKCLDACLLIVKSLDSQNTCNVLYISEWKGRNCKSFLYKGSTIRWHIFMNACIILDGTRESRCIYVRHFFIAQWGRCGIMNVTKRWFIKCNQKSLVNDMLVWFLFFPFSILLLTRVLLSRLLDNISVKTWQIAEAWYQGCTLKKNQAKVKIVSEKTDDPGPQIPE